MMKLVVHNEKLKRWVYETDDKKRYRYVLGKIGRRNLVCIGVNPSTATPDELDETLQSVERIAKNNGYDGWLMLNLYPQIATDPRALDSEKNNYRCLDAFHVIPQSMMQYEWGDVIDVWAAWGNSIEIRAYLRECLEDLVKMFSTYTVNWKMTVFTEEGHPHHPLYQKAVTRLVDFNVNEYLQRYTIV